MYKTRETPFVRHNNNNMRYNNQRAVCMFTCFFFFLKRRLIFIKRFVLPPSPPPWRRAGYLNGGYNWTRITITTNGDEPYTRGVAAVCSRAPFELRPKLRFFLRLSASQIHARPRFYSQLSPSEGTFSAHPRAPRNILRGREIPGNATWN